ncbi:MAG: hypothetical protein AABX47_09070, partial [Nanoarchaeota archaeon]
KSNSDIVTHRGWALAIDMSSLSISLILSGPSEHLRALRKAGLSKKNLSNIMGLLSLMIGTRSLD